MPSSPAPTSRSWSTPPVRRPPASSTCWPAANTASTSSWSTSRPTRWPAPLLASAAREAGIVYSLAYGDQPALICEMVDWARACGFEVMAAGKGTKYLPEFHTSTPDTVWSYYGFTAEMVAAGDFNAQMFNSFLDGTKSAIEMAAVSNATGLQPSPSGLHFPPCGVDDLARVLRPREDGGILHHRGQVEVVSSLERDGRPVFRDLRWGVYVTLAADSDYAPLLQGIRTGHRPRRQLHRHVQAPSPVGPGAGRQRGQRRPAPRTHRRAGRLAWRRGGHRQARPARRTGAGRRSGYGVWPADAGARFGRGRLPAAGPVAPGQAQARRAPVATDTLARCGIRRAVHGLAISAGMEQIFA